MENGPFIDDFPIEPSINRGFSMAMLNNQMVATLPLRGRSDDSPFQAAFAQTTGVLCAVLHSTEEFSKGWQIRLDANGGVEPWL